MKLMQKGTVKPMKANSKKAYIITLLVLVLALAGMSAVVTKPGEYRVIKQFGKIVRVDTSDSNPYGLG